MLHRLCYSCFNHWLDNIIKHYELILITQALNLLLITSQLQIIYTQQIDIIAIAMLILTDSLSLSLLSSKWHVVIGYSSLSLLLTIESFINIVSFKILKSLLKMSINWIYGLI